MSFTTKPIDFGLPNRKVRAARPGIASHSARGILRVQAVEVSLSPGCGAGSRGRSESPRLEAVRHCGREDAGFVHPHAQRSIFQRQTRLGACETWLGTCRVQEDSSIVLTGQLLEMLAALDRNVKTRKVRTILEDPEVNVYKGRQMRAVKPGTIKSLLVYEVLPKPINYAGAMFVMPGEHTTCIGCHEKRTEALAPTSATGWLA